MFVGHDHARAVQFMFHLRGTHHDMWRLQLLAAVAEERGINVNVLLLTAILE